MVGLAADSERVDDGAASPLDRVVGDDAGDEGPEGIEVHADKVTTALTNVTTMDFFMLRPSPTPCSGEPSGLIRGEGTA